MQEAGDELAVRVTLRVRQRRVDGPAVDGEDDPQAAAPGRQDHAVDRPTVEDAETGLARRPRDGDADGAEAEIACVGERALGGRLVRPLERVVRNADEEALAGASAAREDAGDARAGDQSPTGATHVVSIGGTGIEPEGRRA
jgi:hypothetical protein